MATDPAEPGKAPIDLRERSENPFVRAASAASDPLWFSDPEGRLALMVLPASGTGVFALRGGFGLDGRVLKLAQRRANGDGTPVLANSPCSLRSISPLILLVRISALYYSTA